MHPTNGLLLISYEILTNWWKYVRSIWKIRGCMSALSDGSRSLPVIWIFYRSFWVISFQTFLYSQLPQTFPTLKMLLGTVTCTSTTPPFDIPDLPTTWAGTWPSVCITRCIRCVFDFTTASTRLLGIKSLKLQSHVMRMFEVVRTSLILFKFKFHGFRRRGTEFLPQRPSTWVLWMIYTAMLDLLTASD